MNMSIVRRCNESLIAHTQPVPSPGGRGGYKAFA
jgi:hypothetical protein